MYLCCLWVLLSSCHAGVQAGASYRARNGRNVKSRTLRDIQSMRMLLAVVTNRGKRWVRDCIGESSVQRERRCADWMVVQRNSYLFAGWARPRLRCMVCITVALISVGEIWIAPSHVSWSPNILVRMEKLLFGCPAAEDTLAVVR
jgi:hypothetical protein